MKRIRPSLVLAAALLGAVAVARADWVTYQGDAAHTGYVRGSFRFRHAHLLWQAPIATDEPLTGLAVAAGTVFVTNQARFVDAPSFHALDQATGAELWSRSFVQNDTTSAPGYANGVVYFQTDGHSDIAGNSLNAYDARTGAAVFNAPYDAQWELYLNPTPFGGNVLVGGGYYGGMYSFNATDGTQNWFGSVPQYDGWTPATDGTYAYAYTGSGDTTPISGVLTMLRLADGSTAASVVDPVYDWRGYTMNSAVVVGPNHQAFTINGGRLVSWDTTLDDTHTPHIAWNHTAGFSGQPSLARGRLYVIAGGELAALDAATGAAVWTWTPPSGALEDAMIVTDNVVFARTETDTFAINTRGDHRTLWSWPVSGALAFTHRRLYVAGADGVVYAFAG